MVGTDVTLCHADFTLNGLRLATTGPVRPLNFYDHTAYMGVKHLALEMRIRRALLTSLRVDHSHFDALLQLLSDMALGISTKWSLWP